MLFVILGDENFTLRECRDGGGSNCGIALENGHDDSIHCVVLGVILRGQSE